MFVLTFVPHESPDVGGIRDLTGFLDWSSIMEYFCEFEHATGRGGAKFEPWVAAEAETGCAQTTLASTSRYWAVLATAEAAAPAARNRNINSHWEFPLSLAAATVNSKCVNRGNASAYISYSQNTWDVCPVCVYCQPTRRHGAQDGRAGGNPVRVRRRHRMHYRNVAEQDRSKRHKMFAMDIPVA